jgi:hypothetical protein
MAFRDIWRAALSVLRVQSPGGVASASPRFVVLTPFATDPRRVSDLRADKEETGMDAVYWIIIAIAVALVVIVLAGWSYARARRSTALKDQFGPEYDRTVDSAGSRRKAEQELAGREEAHDELDIRPLSEAARTRYLEDWQRAERRFVDDPELAAREADSIVRGVLDDKGYPDDDFDSRAAAVSVDHPTLVSRYRHGHDMVHGNGAKGDQRTENLRKAMVDFRAVFEQLVEPAVTPEPSAQR